MKTTSYDAIVIGAGQAGPPLAIRLAKAGKRTALVEREHLGGTCVNDGCIPTKTLVASARAAHVARRAADYGVRLGGDVAVDMRAVKARKDGVVAQSIESLRKWLASTDRLTLVWGHARFTGPHAIDVNGETLEAPQIFLNVGGRATLPSWPGIGDVPVLTNTTMMAIDALPEHLVIAGGSYIGLEAAGVATDARGFIVVDDELRTNVPGIWALGDVNGRGAFTHTAYNDHQIAATNLLGGERRKVTDRIGAYALFTDPPLGRVGMTEAEVRKRGKPALVGVLPMTRVGRARERGETQGFMTVLVDAESERILGAALLCIEGDEIVHSLLDVMAADASYKVVERAVHIHPTVSELIPTLLERLTPLDAHG